MPFHFVDGIKYYTFSILDDLHIKHAVFTRHGGVSPNPWYSLNFGSLVGDEPQRVMENHRRAFRALQCDLETKYDAWQVHSADVVIAESPRPFDQAHKQADAILTQKNYITLFMRFADCVPILIADRKKKVIGIIHAGWQGTLKKISYHTIKAMQQFFHCNPFDIVAAIGPSICPNCYEVGEEVLSQYQQNFSHEFISSVFQVRENKYYLDLWKANHLILNEAGILHVEIANLCTFESNEDWYSHRKEKGKTGRFGALITLDS